jgi:hypothetical protein
MTIKIKSMRIDFFMSFKNTYWSKNHGFWMQNERVIINKNGDTLYMFNLGWKKIGFFFFIESNDKIENNEEDERAVD